MEVCRIGVFCSAFTSGDVCSVSYGFDPEYRDMINHFNTSRNSYKTIVPQLTFPKIYFIEITLFGDVKSVLRESFKTGKIMSNIQTMNW